MDGPPLPERAIRAPRGGAVRLADVAAAAEVSIALASRVLNADPAVRASAETRKRVLDAAAALGYVPNIAAKSLRIRRNGLIGLVVHDLSSPIHLELMQGARAEAAAHNSFLVLGDVDELLNDDDVFKVLVNGNRVDGLIVQGGHAEFGQRIADIARVLPTVVVNAPPRAEQDRVSSVAPDEPAATRMLTEHLLSLGHTRIGLVSGPRDSMTGRLREEGIVSALGAVGLELRPEDRVHADWSANGGRAGFIELASRWRAGTERPTALIAGNSLIGIGVLGAAARQGLSIPQDVSVAAVHDTWINEHLVPSLTTVSLPLREMGVVAVRQLLTAPDAASRIVLSEPPPVLHARDSTAPPA
ncbi:DNA-binding LacI/PurR family transcriptional regulator [Microbacterium resistens]|uniref:DNA-binding LacI/PurR family transcriptional regulator n=1 Tax=Microbacterium resistens TaxID=156977 RepID=A0ABU1S9Y6_9MICO|nr:LacI family DNA-binding transcriptional regulator [Microbacterium resistens]MDR6866424.1 DNA-binding LacI/PurR family transcriptional regulator [Microbacterium resistens]